MKKIMVIASLAIAAACIKYSMGKSMNFWQNWSGNQTCAATHIFYPKNRDELINTIKNASKKASKIRAYGSSHSWSPIVCADYLVNTDALNKVLSIDKEKKLIKVEAGIKIYELNKILESHNLALPNQSYTQAQSIAGALSTATHGTGKTGTFASFVTQIELLTADGSMQTLSLSNEPEYFKAALVAIGSLGIIYSVTLQCVDLYTVTHSRVTSDFKTVSENYQQKIKDHDFYMFFWNPYTDSALEFIWDKTTKSRTPLKIKLREFTDRLAVGHWTGMFTKAILDTFPSITPAAGNLFHKVAATSGKIGYPHEILTLVKKSDQEMIYQEIEIAVPASKLKEAAEDLRVILNNYAKQNFYMLMWGVLFRFAKKDTDALLTTAAFDETVYISVTTSKINEKFFKDIQDAMQKYNGHPHWGKINFLDYQTVKAIYSDKLSSFIKIRNELDPQGMFLNQYTEKIFKS